MTESRLFWLATLTGNLVLLAGAVIWWRFGWTWALLTVVGGPVVMVGCGVIALVLFFLIDGRRRPDVPCITDGCEGVAPVQLSGPTYARPFCQVCETEQRRIIVEAGRV